MIGNMISLIVSFLSLVISIWFIPHEDTYKIVNKRHMRKNKRHFIQSNFSFYFSNIVLFLMQKGKYVRRYAAKCNYIVK